MRGMVEGLRNEMYRQMGQFERDKVSGPDEKGESGDRVVSQDMAEVVSDGTALEGSSEGMRVGYRTALAATGFVLFTAFLAAIFLLILVEAGRDWAEWGR